MTEFATTRQRDAAIVMRHPAFKSLTYVRRRNGANQWAIVIRMADGQFGTVFGETTVEAFESARVALEHEDSKGEVASC